MTTIPKLSITRKREQQLEQLSPFELKDSLIKLADDKHLHEQFSMLNAGRGNPNWIATAPREAYYALGAFAIQECRLTMNDPSGLAGLPQKTGIAKRFYKYLQDEKGKPGIDLLLEIYKKGVLYFSPDVDELVHEFAEGVIGCQYPVPVRMLHYCERVVRAFLIQELCPGQDLVGGRYDIFATEGGTAAMCYVFDSLVENCLLKKGDRIALGVPAFTPYLEIPELAKFDFKVTYIHGSDTDKDGNSNFQYPDSELDKLGDKSIKAFFIINPSNPTSVMINERSRKYLIKVVKNLNPNLMILTDDVYGTFVNGFSSLLNDLPRNTICVYSFSKYFGATGWRLGAIALHQDNIYDDMLTAIPQKEKDRLAKMYESLTLKPEKLKFIDRMVANSRDVALNHTAGLSTPQQVMMAFFAGFAVIDRIDRESAYKIACNKITHKRYDLFWKALGIPVIPDPDRADYYCTFDLREWALKNHGKEFFAWLEKNFEPVDVVFRLAEECSVVLLNGSGFAGPEWSVRVSLANLDDRDYTTIGRALATVLNQYVDAWKK